MKSANEWGRPQPGEGGKDLGEEVNARCIRFFETIRFSMHQRIRAENVAPRRLRQEIIGECNLLTISKGIILKRMTRFPSCYTSEDASKLAAVCIGISVRRAQLSLLEAAEIRWREKFNPDQPRVPAGYREGGQWTDSGDGTPAGAGAPATNEPSDNTWQAILSSVPLSSSVVAENPDANVEFVTAKNAISIDYSVALTGISTIDDATKILSETLAQTMSNMDFIPEWTPQIYGTAVHVEFAAELRTLGIKGISPSDVEQSFFNGDAIIYGEPGSVRTDVILRNDIGDIIAIYDVKTGGAMLTAARVRELRDHTGVGIEVPIIELQVTRGARIKSQMHERRRIGSITARLWNPVHQGSVGRAAGA